MFVGLLRSRLRRCTVAPHSTLACFFALFRVRLDRRLQRAKKCPTSNTHLHFYNLLLSVFVSNPFFDGILLQGVPEDAPYRVNVEALYKHRLKLCETHEDVPKVESALGLGNIEEVIAMGYDELNLIPVYIGSKLHEK